MNELDQRVSKLEYRLDNIEMLMVEIKNEHRRKMDNIEDTLLEIQDTLAKQKGFWAGAIFSLTGLFSVVTWFIGHK